MSTEYSPRFPAISLADAVKYTDLLFKNAGRTALDADAAVKAMGYNGSNGASRATMSALRSYGLLTKTGGNYRLSDEGVRVIRPKSEPDRIAVLRQLAVRPSLFSTLHNTHFECSEQVLATILLHQGFPEEGSKRAAKIYKENVAFAQLEPSRHNDESIVSGNGAEYDASSRGDDYNDQFQVAPKRMRRVANILAEYSIPLGPGHDARLILTGEEVRGEHFDALERYVKLFKELFGMQGKLEG